MLPNSSETQDLLALALAGNQDARNRLLERHREALRRMVHARLNPALARRVDASDIVQDALVKASRRLSDYLREAQMPFQRWLQYLVRDRIVDAHRRHELAARRSVQREQSLEPAAADQSSALSLAGVAVDGEMTPAAAALHHELELRFQAALEALDTTDREIILMRHFEHLTNQQAARLLNLSEAAAGMRYLRALRRLKPLLQEPE